MVRCQLLRPKLLGLYVLMYTAIAASASAQAAAPLTMNVPGPVSEARGGPQWRPIALTDSVARHDSTRQRDLALVPTPQPRSENRSDLALMAVGAAALLVGLVVGNDAGTAIAVGGGVVGLIGLYRFMR